MSHAPADRLLQTIRVSAPGAPDDLISLQVFNVADEFFRRTMAWRYETEILLLEDITDYNFGVPNGSALVRVMSVTHNGIPVHPNSGGQAVQSSFGTLGVNALFPDGDALFFPDSEDLDVNDIFSWAIYRPDYLSVSGVGASMVQYPLKLILALTVSADSLQGSDFIGWDIPEWCWDMFFHDWLDGTLSRLYGMPAKPWTNAVLGAYHGKKFRNHMAYRKQEAARGFVFNQPAWRFARW